MKKILTTPIKAEDLEDIKIGDVIYLTGTLVTARDAAHRRLVKQHHQLPVDLNGLAIFHAGPIMVPCEESPSGYKVVSESNRSWIESMKRWIISINRNRW